MSYYLIGNNQLQMDRYDISKEEYGLGREAMMLMLETTINQNYMLMKDNEWWYLQI